MPVYNVGIPDIQHYRFFAIDKFISIIETNKHLPTTMLIFFPVVHFTYYRLQWSFRWNWVSKYLLHLIISFYKRDKSIFPTNVSVPVV